MLPDNQLSTEPVPAPFLGGRALPVTKTVDYETGGIALQDPSEGLQYQVWRARILSRGTEIVVDADSVQPTTLITGTDITEVSLAFDNNMRPVIAYVENGTAKLHWYDTTIPGMTTTDYPGIITPRVTYDDKRTLQNQVADVIMAYIRDSRLYCRQQRDRYTVEIDVDPDDLYAAEIAASPGLIKIGMNRQLRPQFLLGTPA